VHKYPIDFSDIAVNYPYKLLTSRYIHSLLLELRIHGP